ncbi:MAG TPA: nucleotidyltransferase [Saprospirales bacterium]|nr:nucleotidyltransferase [Saprospirales bacterium]
MNLESNKLKEIKKLCKDHKVKTLGVFGSVVRDDFREDSDIDFVVDFEEKDPFKYTDLYFDLKERLEILLQRQIDLIEERAIKNRFFRQELDRTKILIYEQ